MTALIACHGCDLIVDVGDLADGYHANCPRCGHFLTRFRLDDMNRVWSYSVSAMILLVLANSFSFLSFSSTGLESVMTLGATPGALWDYGMPWLAGMVGAFIIGIPALVLILLAILSTALIFKRSIPGLRVIARGAFFFKSWAMVEVFIIGVIVSLVKLPQWQPSNWEYRSGHTWPSASASPWRWSRWTVSSVGK